MRSTERERLLKDILPGDELSGFRQATLEFGLNAMRARQKRRQMIRIGTVALAALALGGGLLWQTARLSSTGRQPGPPGVASAPVAPAARTVKFISDDELLSLFPSRAVALIGKPGNQQLLFLDEEETKESYQ